MAQGSHKMLRNMSVQQVVEHADEPFFDDFYSPKNWFRSADAMLKQASVYEHEADLQTAYFLLYRHAKLVLDLLPSHPDAKDPKYKPQWLSARKDVKRSLAKLELLKPRINKRYEKYQARLDAAKLVSPERRDSLINNAGASAAPFSDAAPQLDPSKDLDVAVELANSRFASRGYSSTSPDDSTRDLSSALRDTRQYVERAEHASNSVRTSHAAQDHPSQSAFVYPSVGSRATSPSSLSSQPARGPSLPPKVPNSPPGQPATSPSPPAKIPTASSTPSRPTTPQRPIAQFAPASHLEDGTTLRTVFLPRSLRTSFLRLAARNTARSLETLGLLCGTLHRNALFITHLLVPPQTATTDTCEMTEAGETALDDFISAHSAPDVAPDSAQAAALAAGRPAPPNMNTLVLGWIHTHPTQTCFLSSRDLHTHVWYQASLPESVAIVCAPSHAPPGDWGAFRLTDPPGMGIVRACKRPGIFHPHDEPTGGRGVYTDVVGRPGHVIEGDMPLEVVDLRDK